MSSKLQPGEVVRQTDGSIWYVESVNFSGACIVPVTGYKTEIVTSKRTRRKRKKLIKYLRPMIVSAESGLEVLDPKSFNMNDVMRRVMARKEGTETMEKPGKVAAAEGTEKVKGTFGPRAASLYVRTNKEAKEMKGQGRLILDFMNSTTKPMSVAQIAQQIKGAVQTRQDPERVVGYYLSKWKREGLVNAVEPEKTEAATA